MIIALCIVGYVVGWFLYRVITSRLFKNHNCCSEECGQCFLNDPMTGMVWFAVVGCGLMVLPFVALLWAAEKLVVKK